MESQFFENKLELQNPAGKRGWILSLIISVLTGLALCLTLVWLNIERMDIGYKVRDMEEQERIMRSSYEKLEVERAHLLTPERLTQKAASFKMRYAMGRIRKITEDDISGMARTGFLPEKLQPGEE